MVKLENIERKNAGTMSRPLAALIAGTIGVAVNTALLKTAAPLGIEAESGGLLRLMTRSLAPLMNQTGISETWLRVGLPAPNSLVFWLGFHLATGLGMALLYAYVFEPLLPGNGLLKGSLFALVPWLINGFVVLPLLGQGIIGVRALTLSGIIYFFVANWSFTATLGVLYERWKY